MLINDYSTTEFSNDNFAIIGRLLYLATQYEKSFREYFTVNVLKYPLYFVHEMKEFSKLTINNLSEKELYEISAISSKLTFNRIITFFFDHIINKILPSDEVKEIFIKAKEFRNFIAHELCNFELSVIEAENFRDNLINENEEEIKNLTKCVVLMDNTINEFNKESTKVYSEAEIADIYYWILN